MPVVRSRRAKKPKQCLRINFKEDPSCLDPRRGRNMSTDSQVQAMLFEGLLRLEPDGSLSPAQASHFTVSSDQKTYTFYLRDTFWSDGTPVTAKDFELTWKTLLLPDFPTFDIHALFCIKNAKAAKEGTLPLSEVGITAPDLKTLVVELEHPTFCFLHIVASTLLFPINQIQDQLCPAWYLEASEHFVSNGPFMLTEWTHHSEILLTKNPFYRLSHQIKLDQVQIQMINSGIARLHMHATGLFDIVGLPLSNLPHDLYREMLQQNLLHIVQTPGTMVCMFNTEKFPFQNANIRKAFAYAIDRKHIVENITQTKEIPALGIIPPQLNRNNGAEPEPFFRDNDLSSAKKFLKKGLEELQTHPEALRGTLTFSFWKHDHCCPEIPQFLHEQWKKNLGVHVELEALDFKTLHQKGRSGDFSMGYFVPSSMYFDPLELLDRFRYPHNPRNYPHWNNAQYRDYLNCSELALTKEARFDLLKQAEQVMMDEMPIAPIFYWNYALLVQPHVKGFSISPLGHIYFDRIKINFQ